MKTALRLALYAAIAGAASPALAAPRLDGVLGDHAVIQRGQPIVLSGDAAAGETILIALAGRTVTTKAGRDGRFEARLPALPAGGPYDLTIAANSGAAVVRDILIGDVFLCSGQSNMELAVENAQTLFPDAHPAVDDQLRLLTVAKVSAASPVARFAEQPHWAAAGPATVPTFSAACFYMVQALRRTAKVPIGAIHSSWGGSRISAWLSDSALRKAGLGAEADLLALYARDPAAADRKASTIWESWWRAGSGDAMGREPWQPAAALDWKPVPAMTNFETWGVPELADYNGMIWYQRTVEVTAAQARGPAILSLGTIDDADRTWVNGQGVGGSSLASKARVYTLPVGTLKPGANVITVNDDDVYAFGGMTGPADTMRVTFADGSSAALGSGWRYAIAKRLDGAAPRVPWDDINGDGTLYNAMIAPLASTKVAGIAWYQGESDTGIPGYDRRLTALIADWRTRFGTPETGFGIVQLANYGKPTNAPSDSGWGYVRDAQRRVAAADRHTGIAVALDIGDALDIHPGEKHEVGQRLAKVMRSAVYGAPGGPSGPAIAAADAGADGSIALRFGDVTGALHARGANQAIGFELCDTAPGTCRYAAGSVAGTTVTLPGDGKPVTRVRYAWADAPAVNLSDDAMLPVGTFEIPVAPRR
ncbi:sialate O-acetylesterase [Sphingomonas sp. Leaf242]|uniref:sialate O-acetylesterase n=1 Tax=Sphingomonas sp. Leaf242 TaxID=1736304 RepID=UPI000712E1DA|nr:sialate O-acetylesterase [Sphingomonas sp. Leaf242]KQO13131.1 9-O-acetylesterase [Sphingomonas sp. Leaf242]